MSTNWNQIFKQMRPEPNENEIEDEFIIPLIKDFGYDKSEYCLQLETGYGRNKVDFAVRSNANRNDIFHDSRTEPFLLIEAKKPSEDIRKPTHINQLMSYLQHKNCQTAQFGILTNSKQIQLYRSHGKVVHPLTKALPLRDDKANENIGKVKELIQKPKKALKICIYNNKGGVGKTTTAINLAATLGVIGWFKRKEFIFKYNNSKKKVLAVDFDSQRDLTKSLFREKPDKNLRGLTFSYEDCNLLSKDKTTLTESLDGNNISLQDVMYSYKVKNKKSGGKVSEVSLFDVIPADNEFRRYNKGEGVSFLKLRELLDEFTYEYDYIVIDCPTQPLSFYNKSGLYAADVVLIPANHSDLGSLHNAAKVITEIIPQINELRDDELVALPIFYNDEKKDIRIDEKFSRREEEMFRYELELIIKSYGSNYDLQKYFKKITGETVVILSSAVISSHSFDRLPAAYKNIKVLKWYAELVEHYFLRPADKPERVDETMVSAKPEKASPVEIIKNKGISADKVKSIRAKIYKNGKIDRKEAEAMFKYNKQFSEADNDPSWKALFVEAMTDHFLKDEISPGVVDEDESAYIIGKIRDDGIDDTELALLVNIVMNATSCHESLNAFILEVLRASVLGDGVIDDNNAEMIGKGIYSAGKSRCEDQTYADFLFDLNDSTSGATNSPKWEKLFVKAISEYLMKNKTSPCKIDEKKAEWLIERIGTDGDFDDNKKALLSCIKKYAKEIHPKLRFKLDFYQI